ncbi:hypothetical protein PAXINDRAFT_16240 [Paxillus involutus ATCC 200175]|uniref:F-box domain-containing protein n=1 Tax=Paxillus involutus ATCC 200175 TaxID=664439 RepID=A0A0C9TU69_PAXIN|nr:hypothetical protein PAXINDRAFT_16240 [Paxillus involutus ATCC 200175]
MAQTSSSRFHDAHPPMDVTPCQKEEGSLEQTSIMIDSQVLGPEDASSSRQPAKKRQSRRKGKQTESSEPVKRSRRRGRLEMMPEMNLDILFYIFGFLHPMDILNLARTTKSFRQLLMRKSSAFIWKTSCKQIDGLPDCPPDLTEPQYVNLVFDPHCHAIPGEFVDRGRRRVYLVVRATAQALHEEFKQVPVLERDGFIKGKYRQHATKCEVWHRGVTEARKFELEDVRAERTDAISARLRDLGYGDEIDYFGPDLPVDERKYFSVSKPLTDKEWDRIRPGLVERMNFHRKVRMQSAVYNPRRTILCNLYDQYVRKPAPLNARFDLLPHVVDVANFPPFEAIIKSLEETIITPDSFAEAFIQLPSFVRGWRDDIEAQLAALIKIPADLMYSDTPGPSAQTPQGFLRLACAVFSKASGGVAMFPDIIYPQDTHTFNVRLYRTVDDDPDSIGAQLFRALPWSLSDASGRSLAKFFAPAAYIRQLNAAPSGHGNLRQVSKCLSDNAEVDDSMDQKIVHFASFHSDGDYERKTGWTVVDAVYMDKIQAVEQSQASYVDILAPVRCPLCQVRAGDPVTPWELRHHLLDKHSMTWDEAQKANCLIKIESVLSRRVREVRMRIAGGLVSFDSECNGL